MSDVKRYFMVVKGWDEVDLFPDGDSSQEGGGDGPFVLASDYDSLRTSLAAAIRERDALEDNNDTLAADLAMMEVERDALRAALVEAREMVCHWSDYASEYMRDKHNLDGDIAKLDAALKRCAPQPAAARVTPDEIGAATKSYVEMITFDKNFTGMSAEFWLTSAFMAGANWGLHRPTSQTTEGQTK